MGAPVLSYVLTHILASIPKSILMLGFTPDKYSTTLDNRIIDEVISSRVLLDVNLMMGKKTQISLLQEWIINVQDQLFALTIGSIQDACYYLIPPEARQGKNISTIQGITNDYANSGPLNSSSIGTVNNLGNTITSLAGAALSSRTEYNYPVLPQATLQSQNLIRVYPNLYTDGLVMDCTLEYDSEFTNANQNVIFHLRNLCLNAVKTYIYTKLVIEIDTAEILGGMAIGAVKDRVLSYEGAFDEYQDLLFKVRGAMIMDPEVMAGLVSMLL